MLKSEKPDNILQIARYFNEHPRNSVKSLLAFCQLHNILRSYDAVYRALRLMEHERILLNGSILMKNHEGYRNIHYLFQTEDVGGLMNALLQENRNSIEAVYRSRQGKENIVYAKSTRPLDCKGFNLIEEIEWESYHIIFPWDWDGTETFLFRVPEDISLDESSLPRENITAAPNFEITEDMRVLLYWYKVNVRLPDIPIMRETGFDHRKVKTLRKRIFDNSIVHFPIFLFGARHYVCLYFSFFTEYYEFFLRLFARNSVVSYMVKGKNGRTFLFVNTTRPGWVLSAMEAFEETGVIQKTFFCFLQARWDYIIADFKAGKIPGKYFWMFGMPKKK